jgi:AcrR family transcriptional regulator
MEEEGEQGADLLGALAEGPARLPAGEVAASQRRRLLAAMVAAAAEKGYVNVSVADVVGRARVSRASFYEQFPGKADCFIAAFHACTDHLVGTLRAALPDHRPPRERLHAFFVNYFGALASFPEGARVCLVEIYAVGPEAARHRRLIQLDFVAVLRGLHAGLAEAGEPVRPLDEFAFEVIVAAISSLATNQVAAGDTARLTELAEPLESFVLTHFGLDAHT